MKTQDPKQSIFKEVDNLRDEMSDLAHQIHADPEVGWETPRSMGRVASFLEKHGFTVRRDVAGLSSAFDAFVPERVEHRPAICLLAEYDALPKLGHGCGHNLQGAVMGGAAIALSKILKENDIPGSVHVMGCPFEEGGGGKVVMVNEGAFDKFDFSLHWHISNNPANRIVVGCPNNAAVRLHVRFRGKSAHAASKPYKAISAQDAALLTLTAVNTLQRYLHPDRGERVHGVMIEGGRSPSVVPDYSQLEFTVRANRLVFLEKLIEKTINCAKAGALATGAQVEIERGHTYAERIVLQSYRRTALDNLPLLGLPREERDPRIFGSADSNNVSQVVPHLTCKSPVTDDAGVVGHSVEMVAACDSDFARDSINKAAKWMAVTAFDLLSNTSLRNEVQAEFQERKRSAANGGEQDS